MTQTPAGRESSIERAKIIAVRSLAGDYDPLIACRELADMRDYLPGVGQAVMDVFVGIASEVDDLPLGVERQQWSAAALKSKDQAAAVYRGQIKDVVNRAFERLLVELTADSTQ